MLSPAVAPNCSILLTLGILSEPRPLATSQGFGPGRGQSPALPCRGEKSRLVVQDNAQQAAVDGEPTVVVDEAEVLKLVHEMTDARPGGADHLRQTLLIDSGDHC